MSVTLIDLKTITMTLDLPVDPDKKINTLSNSSHKKSYFSFKCQH